MAHARPVSPAQFQGLMFFYTFNSELDNMNWIHNWRFTNLFVSSSNQIPEPNHHKSTQIELKRFQKLIPTVGSHFRTSLLNLLEEETTVDILQLAIIDLVVINQIKLKLLSTCQTVLTTMLNRSLQCAYGQSSIHGMESIYFLTLID